jgi:hypothetical protein
VTHTVCLWPLSGSIHPRPPKTRIQSRKDVAAVFSGLLRITVDGRQPCMQYLQEHQDVLITLTKACVLFRVPTVAPGVGLTWERHARVGSCAAGMTRRTQR